METLTSRMKLQSKRLSATVHSTVHLPTSPEAVKWLLEVSVEGHVAADCTVLHRCLQKQYFYIDACSHTLLKAQQLRGHSFFFSDVFASVKA